MAEILSHKMVCAVLVADSQCQLSSTTWCSLYSMYDITCKDLAGFSVQDAVAAYCVLCIKNEAYVSPGGNDALLTPSNCYVHTVLICAFLIPPQDCVGDRLLWGSEKLFTGVV